MAKDGELLLSQVEAPQPILRLYRWAAPCITMGIASGAFALTHLRSHDLPWYVRPTGGGLVHHTDDFSISVTVPSNHPWWRESVRDVYRLLHSLVQEALADVGIATDLFQGPSCGARSRECFTTPVYADLTWHGRKVFGGAIRKSRFGWLYQGTLKLPWSAIACDPDRLAEAIIAQFHEASPHA